MSRAALSLEEQVRRAIIAYAYDDRHLQRLYDEHGLPWRGEDSARKLIDAAVKQIFASVQGRGETSYSLLLPNGRPNSARVASLAKYLQKVVAKKAEMRIKKGKQSRDEA